MAKIVQKMQSKCDFSLKKRNKLEVTLQIEEKKQADVLLY